MLCIVWFCNPCIMSAFSFAGLVCDVYYKNTTKNFKKKKKNVKKKREKKKKGDRPLPIPFACSFLYYLNGAVRQSLV